MLVDVVELVLLELLEELAPLSKKKIVFEFDLLEKIF